MEGAEPGSLVEVELIDSEGEFGMMKGKIIRILEETGNLDLGFEMILRETRSVKNFLPMPFRKLIPFQNESYPKSIRGELTSDN